MGLLDTILSVIDNKKRTLKRGVMDMLDNPSDWSNMTAARMDENMYGGPENWDAMKKYYSRQPYDKNLKDAAEKALTANMINESLGAVTAWHGSPHKFDKFDMSKIGTGEGSQAYGHGLYVAENPLVANSYRAMANNPGRRQGGLTKEGRDKVVLDALIKLNSKQFSGGDVNKLVDVIQKHPGAFDKPEQMIARISEYDGNNAPSFMYKVDIPDDAVSKLLDLEKDIPEEVRSKLSKSLLDKFGSGISLGNGEQAYNEIVNAFKSAGESNYKNAATNFLKENGIPGLKFTDAGSRSAGQGSSNYVLFDDQLPRILERNGQPTGLQPWAKGEWKGLLDEPAPKLTEFEQRHLTAQKNAALPVEQGGLGLPVDNTAMDRARAMGFDTPAYHTSRTGVDTNVLDSGQYAMAPFDSIGTHFGTKEAALDRFNRTVGTTEQIKGSSYPVLLKGDKPYLDANGLPFTEDPLTMMLSAKSDYGNLKKSNAALRDEIFKDHSVIPYVNDVEAAGSTSYIAPPQNIRSRFAAFDPMRRHEADLLGYADPRLLGGIAGGGLLGLGGYSLMGDK